MDSLEVAVDRPPEMRLDFEEFFRNEAARLGKALYALTGDPVEAEDLVEESMVRAYERWDRVGVMDSPAGYVYRVAFNLHRRRHRRRISTQIAPAGSEHEPDPADSVGTRLEILRALRILSVEQREALILVEWLGMDTEEAGRLLGIEAASVRSRLHRARTALRSRWGGSNE